MKKWVVVTNHPELGETSEDVSDPVPLLKKRLGVTAKKAKMLMADAYNKDEGISLPSTIELHPGVLVLVEE